jgi:hypothetical protein
VAQGKILLLNRRMNGPVKLTFEIKNQHPVELVDLTQSLLSFADEYKRYIAGNEDPVVAEDVRLYVKEMRSGSIIADLVANAPYALPLIENANTVFEFIKYLKEATDYLLGKSDKKPELDKANYENFVKILEPISKDHSSQLNIGAININQPQAPVIINLNSLESNAAQNAAKRELDALKEPVTGMHEKVLLYWYQARNDPHSDKGDRAIIESIFSSPVKVVFVNETIKAKILSGDLFHLAYVVDVAVETIKGRPALYRILEMHESFERGQENKP